jgi:hypothetical protein
MIICDFKPKSFKEFKELSLMHKFGNVGFVFLFGYGGNGYIYKIVFLGTRRDLAFKEAYRLLFTEIDEWEAQFVTTSMEGRLKMPISCNFHDAYRVN